MSTAGASGSNKVAIIGITALGAPVGAMDPTGLVCIKFSEEPAGSEHEKDLEITSYLISSTSGQWD